MAGLQVSNVQMIAGASRSARQLVSFIPIEAGERHGADRCASSTSRKSRNPAVYNCGERSAACCAASVAAVRCSRQSAPRPATRARPRPPEARPEHATRTRAQPAPGARPG